MVTEGYGLIQPRISVAVESANKSLFTRIFAGQGGIDPYTSAVSDVYQDCFGEGIFTGKGIYDVEVFQQALEGAIPDYTVLSHDLWKDVMYGWAWLQTSSWLTRFRPVTTPLLCACIVGYRGLAAYQMVGAEKHLLHYPNGDLG